MTARWYSQRRYSDLKTNGPVHRGLSLGGLGLAALLAALPITSLKAAPFCIVNEGVPPQCIYHDPDSCNREVRRLGSLARCSANPREVSNLSGSGQFCVVIPGAVPQCIYVDRSTCAREALRLHGVCSHAVASRRGVPGIGAPDPYEITTGVTMPGRDPYALPERQPYEVRTPGAETDPFARPPLRAR